MPLFFGTVIQTERKQNSSQYIGGFIPGLQCKTIKIHLKFLIFVIFLVNLFF